MVVWITGNSGAGKSTACETLSSRGYEAVDADWDGYSRWTDRVTGEVIGQPPYPVPAGWLDRYAWTIDRTAVEQLAARSRDTVVFLVGSAENETDVVDLFDVLVCLVIDDQTLRERLTTRTTNAFGRNPEELASALQQNPLIETAYRRRGANMIDATLSPGEVADLIVARTTG